MKIFIPSLKFLSRINKVLIGGLLVHVLVWLAFIIISVQLLVFEQGYRKNILNSILFYSVQLFFFYANSYYWLPKTFKEKEQKALRFLKLMGSQLSCLVVFLILISMLFGNLRISLDGTVKDWLLLPSNLLAFVLPFMVYWPFSTGYYYFVHSKEVNAENLRLKHEAMLLTQRWLKAELNPHFINNCYHFLDGLLLIDVKKAEAGLSLMQDMMQYYLTIPTDGFIQIEEELRQCANLIDFYKLRYDAVFVSVLAEHGLKALPCLPMSLVLLMENILKYGVIQKKEERAQLKLRYKEGVLEISTCNKIRQHSLVVPESTGRGLANLEAQLQHFYPNAFRLSRGERDGYYHLQLQIWLDKRE